MNSYEFVDHVLNIDQDKVKKLESVYNCSIPDLLGVVISKLGDTLFFDDKYVVLSFEDIASKTSDYGVDFISKKYVPIIDCYDGDFIVFDLNTNLWSEYNVYDDLIFNTTDKLGNFLAD